MYHPPGYVWVAILIGPIAFIAAASAMLYGGAMRAGLRQRTALLVAAGTVIVPGGWLAISAVIAGRGWYDNANSGPPVLPIATLGALTAFVALSQLPAVRQAATAPGMLSRLIVPQAVRWTGLGPLLYLALGHLPALFALPATLGDIATGIAAPFVARRLANGADPREGIWFNAFGIADLVVSSIIGAIAGYSLVKVTPAADLSALPIALVPTAVVPMLLALHVISLRGLAAAQASHPAVNSAGAAI
jgi:hypothetical protein